MKERRFGALSSSEDPQKLAATVTGLIKLAGGLLAFVGVSMVGGEVDTLADQMGQLVTMGFAFWGLAESAFGIGRKIVVAIIEKFLSA